MKRIFSKKSGFTLVEIVVAFAVFAIMSAMILSMVKLTVEAQRDNSDFADSLEEQSDYLAYHYISDSEKYVEADKTGTFELEFIKGTDVGDANASPVCDVSMDYATRSSVLLDEEGNTNTNSGEGVNYFVGNVNYTNPGSLQGGSQNQGDTIKGLGNSQASRYDTRIMGSRNIDKIVIASITKDESFDEPGKTRYLIECYASGNTDKNVKEDDAPYLQYKLRFCDSTFKEMEGHDKDGKECTYKVYDDATILECGYIQNHGELEDYRLYNGGDDKNRFTVMPTGNGTVRIGMPINTSYTGFGSEFTRFYVVFEGDPQPTIDSFGDNGEDGVYTSYPIDIEEDEYNPNIYGAYPYEKIEKTGK